MNSHGSVRVSPLYIPNISLPIAVMALCCLIKYYIKIARDQADLSLHDLKAIELSIAIL